MQLTSAQARRWACLQSGSLHQVTFQRSPRGLRFLVVTPRGATLLMCLAALIAVLSAVGCGTDTDLSGRSPKLSFVVSSDGVRQPDGRLGMHKQVANCDDAAATLGPSRETIRVQVHCDGPKYGGSAWFVVERYLPRSPVRMRGPGRYFGTLEATDGPGVARHGRCTARRRILECRADVSGSVTLAGAFAVKRQTACALAVSVIHGWRGDRC